MEATEEQRYRELGGDDAPLGIEDLRDLRGGVWRVFKLMRDGEWHSRSEIVVASQGTEGLRRMRELRRWFDIEKRLIPQVGRPRKGRLPRRAWEYRLVLPEEIQGELFETDGRR